MIKPAQANAAPRQERGYTTDTQGRYLIMQVNRHGGKVHRSIAPSPRFNDIREADRYARDWREVGVEFVVVECE